MNLFDRILDRKRFILTAAAALALAGILAVADMPRQEDARIPDYWGFIVTTFPGADAEKVERLLVDPIEEYLAEVEEIKVVETTIRTGVAVSLVELHNGIPDIEEAWDEVRRKLATAQTEFPDGATTPTLDRDIQDPESVVLAVTGSSDPLVLKEAADKLKKEFLLLPQVARVKVIGDPGEEIFVEYDDHAARRLNIGPAMLAAQLSRRNLTVPGGTLRLGGKKVVLRLNDEYRSVEEIASTHIVLSSGASIPLREFATVRRGPEEPARARMRFNGRPAVGLGIVPRDGIDVVAFGETVRDRLQEIRSRYETVSIEQVAFQPERVRSRLLDLGKSLLMSVTVVAGVLIAVMGIRLGIIVASIVPLVALSSLAIFAWGGGILHQISIAAFVIALGMLVDNAIVVAESIQRGIDGGMTRARSAAISVRELGLPLAAATGTTLAAFLPMLLARSATGDFTRSLPIVIMITLSMSYLFAVSVTPALGSLLLRKREEIGRSVRTARLGRSLAGFSVAHPLWVLAVALCLTAAALSAMRFVDRRFFPMSDRNQVLVDIRLPEGTHLSETDGAAARLERRLSSLDEVASYASFIGRNAPHFYYNIPQRPNSPHSGQILVNLTDLESVPRLLERIRSFAAENLPHVEVVPRRLEQGPPLDAPVEIRLIGRDVPRLDNAARSVLASLRTMPEAVDVRQDGGLGVPVIRFEVEDSAAARHGLSRSDVAAAVQGRTRGMHVGRYRAGDDPVSILVRSSKGEDFPVEHLSGIDITGNEGKPVPLAHLARSDVEWLPSVIKHRNRERVVTVSSQLREGSGYGRIIDRFDAGKAESAVPAGVVVEYGGAQEGAEEANTAMFRAMPAGIMLLVLILLAEFNSFRRLAIVLVTVPLAAVGVVPGLVISGEPFGFMSLLGVFALAGVVVNNAIVLLDRIEIEKEANAAVSDAVAAAVERRTRPILLTTVTTIAGLLPLAFSESNLWPPMAWAMISGLIASTALTLVVVPALYAVMFPDRAPTVAR